MKKYFLFIALAGLVACGNNENDNNDMHDSAITENHELHTGDTSAGSDKSMMQMMQENMDQMKAIKSTGNPDNDFAALMKVHHMGALEMAQVEVAKGSDPKMKEMAQKMIGEQQKEIAELNTFLSGHTAHGGGDSFYKEVMAKMNSMKMEMDHSGSIDKQFAQMMIPHHQGAIDMAKIYLKNEGHEPTMKKLANTIITDQQREIKELQQWLSKH